MRQRAEETRAEMMLNEPEFVPSISAIEELALFLVRLLPWLFTVLFGGTMEKGLEYETAEPLAVEAPSYPGPAP